MLLSTIDIRKRRKPRASCQYSERERKILEPFKERYRSESNKKSRQQIWMSDILPAMFNYWTENRQIVISEEDFDQRLTALAKWIANNWRPYSTEKAAKSNMRTTYIEVLWRTRKDEVENELKRMLNVQHLDKGDPRVFQQRTAAAKRVYEQMDEQGKEEIKRLVGKYKEEGNDEQTRLQIAEAKGHKKVADWARDAWLQMGMCTLMFYGYMKDDNYVVGVYDNVADHMGLDANQFSSLYKGDILRIKRLFGEYIKGLSRQKGVIDNMPAQPATGEVIMPVVSVTPQGFPLLPTGVFASRTKEYLAQMMRQYLAKHYKLASGGRSEHVPFASIKSNRSNYIDDEYMPQHILLTDPHNMRKQDIQDFLEHVQERQTANGAEAAFRFRAYQRKRALHPAIYLNKQVSPSKEIQMIDGQRQEDDGSQNEDRQSSVPPAPDDDMPQRFSDIQDIDTVVMVNHEQMMALVNQGMHSLQPANGPNEGEPMYVVPASALMAAESYLPELVNGSKSAESSQIYLDPSLRGDDPLAASSPAQFAVPEPRRSPRTPVPTRRFSVFS